jgi:transcriptional regulator with XRE-family HTH domain
MRYALFGKRLKDFRISKGFTQDQLAEILKISRSLYSRYERGNLYPTLLVSARLENLGFSYTPLRLTMLFSEAIRTFKGVISYVQKRQNFRKGIRFTSEQCAWIRQQLVKKEIPIKQVANKAHCSAQNISQVVWGKNNRSLRVQEALALVLGYPTVDALIAAARGKGGTE